MAVDPPGEMQNGKIETGENMRTNQPTQAHLLELRLAASIVVILGLVVVIIHKPWPVIPALGITGGPAWRST